MKKIIFLAILVLAIYSGYQYIRAYLDFNALSGRIDSVVTEPQSHSPDSMVKFIVEEAAKLGIPLSEEDVEVTIEETDKSSLGERLVERSGIDVESKLLVITFQYPVKIFGFTQTFTYDMERVFTAKTSLTDRYEDVD